MATDVSDHPRPWWRLHGATWACVCLVLAAGIYVNLNIVDLLYRLKYGPVRPSLLVSGWPFDAVEEDVVSAVLHLDKVALLANACVVIVLTVGAAVRIERWRRRRPEELIIRSEHVLALIVSLLVVLALEALNLSTELVDVVDYAAAFHWPALSVLFGALVLTSLVFVELVGFTVSGRRGSGATM